jgi:hypothetical protein
MFLVQGWFLETLPEAAEAVLFSTGGNRISTPTLSPAPPTVVEILETEKCRRRQHASMSTI